MKSFFVIFGKGILYFLSFPFILVFLVVYGIYMFLEFLILSVKTIILFFQGKPLGVKDELDEKAMLILKERKREALQSKAAQVQNINNQNTFNQTINNYNIGVNPTRTSPQSVQGISSEQAVESLNGPQGYISEEAPISQGMHRVEPLTIKDSSDDIITPLNMEDRND